MSFIDDAQENVPCNNQARIGQPDLGCRSKIPQDPLRNGSHGVWPRG